MTTKTATVAEAKEYFEGILLPNPQSAAEVNAFFNDHQGTFHVNHVVAVEPSEEGFKVKVTVEYRVVGTADEFMNLRENLDFDATLLDAATGRYPHPDFVAVAAALTSIDSLAENMTMIAEGIYEATIQEAKDDAFDPFAGEEAVDRFPLASIQIVSGFEYDPLVIQEVFEDIVRSMFANMDKSDVSEIEAFIAACDWAEAKEIAVERLAEVNAA